MNALTAPVLQVQRSDALWLIPVIPVIGALVRRAFAPDDAPRSKQLFGFLAPSGIALLLLAAQTWGLLSLEPEARQLVASGWAPIRIGSFEATLGLALDPASALVGLCAATVAVVAQAMAAPEGALLGRDDAPPRHDAIDLTIAGALFALLADGFLGLAIGSVIASVGLAWADTTPRASAMRAFGAARLGDLALATGAVVLLWTLAGSWGIALGLEPNYTRHNPVPANVTQFDALEADEPDVGPTLYPVVVGGAPAALPGSGKGPIDPNAKGWITVAAPAGSRLFLKGALEPAASTPVIRHEVYAGRIDVEIERPSGRRVRFRALEVPPSREVALVPIGPTWSFRELRDQLGAVDGAKAKFVRNLLDPWVAEHRRVGGLGAAHLVAALFALAGLAWIASVAFVDAPLVGALGGLLGLYLLARLDHVIVLSRVMSGAGAVASGLVAIGCGVAAAVAVDARRAWAALLGAQLSIAAIGALVGSPGLALLHGVAAVLVIAIASVTLARMGVRDLRRVSDAVSHAPEATRVLRVSALLLAGAPVPLLGVAFGRDAVLSRAFAADVPGAKIAWTVAAVAVAIGAFAAWRVCLLVVAGPSRKRPPEDVPRSLGAALVVCAAVIALSVPFFGVSRAFLGLAGAERASIESFLDLAVDPAAILGADRAVRVGQGRVGELVMAALAFVGAFVGWGFARRRYAGDDREKPVELESSLLGRVGAFWVALPRAVAWLDDRLFARPLGALVALLSGGKGEER
ncbi:MAG: hypothetical protein HYV09_37030 [Deltaproteobacteria bacterium]|nr:hypothetical protein [Deltaproteobacteria bacterium]